MKLARRGARMGGRRWWSTARPSTGIDLTGHAAGDARVALAEGRAPRPDERFTPRTTAVGAWRGAQPLVANPWGGAAGLLGMAAWGIAVGLRLRRELGAGTRRLSG